MLPYLVLCTDVFGHPGLFNNGLEQNELLDLKFFRCHLGGVGEAPMKTGKEQCMKESYFNSISSIRL